MIDVEREDLITVRQVAETLSWAGGADISPRLIVEWIHRGKLEGCKLGGRWFSSRQALRRFLRRCTGDRDVGPAVADPGAERAHAEAMATLRADGLM